MFKKTLLNNINSNNDIKYKAPLSYRHLRIFGWLMMALMMLSTVFLTMGSVASLSSDKTYPMNYALAGDITGYFGQLAIPFFLLANFALIISSQENIKKLVLTHASLALLVIALYLLCYERYFVGAANFLLGSNNGKAAVDSFLMNHFTRYLSLNVFVDLLMCSLMYLFLVHKPKKVKEKKLVYYRLLVIIPILYELGSMLVKGLSVGLGLFVLPLEVLPFLTNKPIVTFLSFIVIILYLKYQKKIYVKLGGEPKRFQDYLSTNAHSFQVGVVSAITFAAAGFIDLIITSIMMAILSPDVNAFESFSTFKKALNVVQPWGFGKGISLLVVSPVALLFNYRKKYDMKTKSWDFIIPSAGVLVCFLVLLEGAYQILTM